MKFVLINLICLTFAGGLIAEEEDLTIERPIFKAEYSEELDRDELMHILTYPEEGTDEDQFDRYPGDKDVFGNLTRAKNKDTTEIIDGLTVSDLLKWNVIGPAECRKEKLYKREYACRRVEPLRFVDWYCRNCLRRVALHCCHLLELSKGGMVSKRAAKYGIPFSREDSQFWFGVEAIPSYHSFNSNLKYYLRGMFDDADLSNWQLVKGPKTEVFGLLPDELLSREQLLDKLKNNENDWVGPKTVAVHLSMARNKDNTQIVGGLSVTDLLKLNEISRTDCAAGELHRRHQLCFKTSDLKFVKDYCDYCVRTLGEFCVRKMPLTLNPFWRGFNRALEAENPIEGVRKYLDETMQLSSSG